MEHNGAEQFEDVENSFEERSDNVVTMMDVLQEQKDFEDNADCVLGASDDKNCTYSKGYIKRQALYACLTCCSEAKIDPKKRAGICLACSLTCHENHELVELYTKRNFRCDCGNPKFSNHPCQFTPEKPDLNSENIYNQNFSGLYCICHRPYPDPDGMDDEEMIQCIVCEDWLHSSHLDAVVPGNDQYSEMICKGCMDKNEFLHDYTIYAVNEAENEDVDIVSNGKEQPAKVLNGDAEMVVEENGTLQLNGDVSKATDETDHAANVTSDIKENEGIVNDISKKTDIDNKESTNEKVEDSLETPITDDAKTSEENKQDEKTTESELKSDKINKDAGDAKVDEQIESNSEKNVAVEEIAQTLSNEQKTAKESCENLETKNISDTASQEMVEENVKENEPSDLEKSGDNEEKAIAVETKETSENMETTEQKLGQDKPKSDNNKLNEDEQSDKTTKEKKAEDADDDLEKTLQSLQDAIDDSEKTSLETREENKAKTESKEPSVDGESKVSEDAPKMSEVTATEPVTIETSESATVEQISDENQDSTKLENDANNEKVKEVIANASTDESKSTQDVEMSEITSTTVVPESDKIAEDSSTKLEVTASEKDTEMKDGSEPSDAANAIKDTEMQDVPEEKETKEIVDNKTDSEIKDDPKVQEEVNKEPSIENSTIDGTKENGNQEQTKRKLDDDDGETKSENQSKKTKIHEKPCTKPKTGKKIFKGATFWPCNWRLKLCTCNECLEMYKMYEVLFLTDLEDTVTAYEDIGVSNNAGKKSQYEKGLEALSSLDRVQQINALTEYHKMKEKLLDFLKSFKDNNAIVKEEDIKEFFAGMKPRREPDGVYFCR